MNPAPSSFPSSSFSPSDSASDTPADEAVELPWAGEQKFRCFGCSPRNPIGLALKLRQLPSGEISAETTFSERYASYPGIVHGGIVAALVDEVMGDMIALRHGMLAFSVSLRTRNLLPLRVGLPYRTVARVTGPAGRVLRAEADVTGADGELHVTANASYQPIRSDQARLLMGLDDTEHARLRHYFDHEMRTV
jgi:acyl-coenzyme A thioesterase PaaI-like protein